MSNNYIGNKWYKCDFHLHTPASECFTDKNITPEQFIQAVIDKELNCIAITDHNNASWIDKIKLAAQDKRIVVFPGVEVSCGDKKVHLLILFSPDTSSIKIEDFLLSLDMDREDFGKQNAHTKKSVFDVAMIARERNAIVIPAHIDDINGLSYVSYEIRKEFIELEHITSAQMVNKNLILSDITHINSTEVLENIKANNSKITEPEVKDYIACTKLIKENNIGILTFSDNPENESSSKHGLWGIGEKYTWIKMDDNPTFESLRQALLLPELRVKNCFESNNRPYKTPDQWVRKIVVSDLEILETTPLEIEFSPQMTTIIGGRGSGKSSIVRLLTGIFNKDGLKELSDLYEEFLSFYQIKNKDNKGVLKTTTKIEIEIIKNQLPYKITATGFKNPNLCDLVIEKYNRETLVFEKLDNFNISDLFQIDIYNQKQIYELARKPNILRDKVDSLIEEMNSLKKREEDIIIRYKKQYAFVKEIEQKINLKKKLQIELDDITEKINVFNSSGIKEALTNYKIYKSDYSILLQHSNELSKKIDELDTFTKTFNMPLIDLNSISMEHKSEINSFVSDKQGIFDTIASELSTTLNKLYEFKRKYIEDIRATNWYLKYTNAVQEYNNALNKLKEKGVVVEEINNLFTKLQLKKSELDEILKKEEQLKLEYVTLSSIRAEYINLKDSIFKERTDFLKELLVNTNIKIDVKKHRDKNNFQSRLRAILQKPSGFDDDFSKATLSCFDGNFIVNLDNFIKDIMDFRSKSTSLDNYTGKFKNVLKGLNDEQIAELNLLIPEDELQIKYLPSNSNQYKSLHNASAGQRTSSILTFILSDGIIPLILDQPEDDLDNHLIYDLIVERLKSSKEQRQIIVVTHNANIPVNGDSELIVAMNSSSKNIEVSKSGTLEDSQLKEEICTIMEGGESAFRMRSKRYGITK